MSDSIQRAMKADYVKILGENKKMKQKIANLYSNEIYAINFEKCLLALKECEMKESTLKLCDEISQRLE